MEKSKVYALVGGREITQHEVDYIKGNLDPKTAKQFDSEEGKAHLVNELVNQELFYLEAIDKGFDKDDSFKAEAERMMSNLLKQYSLNKLLGNVSIEESEIESYYNTNSRHFYTSGSVRASHILVDEKQQAEEVLKEINSGLCFEDAAKKYSVCPSNEAGGDLGYFEKGKMVPEFEEAAFNLEPGIVGGPYDTPFGFHLIKVTDKKEGTLKPLSEVREQIYKQLLLRKQDTLYSAKINELRKKYEIKFML